MNSDGGPPGEELDTLEALTMKTMVTDDQDQQQRENFSATREAKHER